MFRQHRRVAKGKRRTFKEFGEMVTADEIQLTKDDNIAIDGIYTGLLFCDLATNHLWVDTSKSKATESIEYGMRFYQGDDCIQRLHVDSASELAKAARALGIMIEPSPPYEPQSNGAIEVFVGIIKQYLSHL